MFVGGGGVRPGGAQEFGPAEHPAGAFGEGAQDGGAARAEPVALAVDQCGVPLEGQHLPGERDFTPGAARQGVREQPDERAESAAFGVDGGQAEVGERPGAQTPHAHGQNIGTQSVQQRLVQALGLGGGEQCGDRGRAGEGEGVHLAADGLVEESADRARVLRGCPAVDRDGDHLGAAFAQRGGEGVQADPVFLDGDPAPGERAGEQPGEQFVGGLGAGGVALVQPAGPDRAGGLGAAAEHHRAPAGLGQGGAAVPAFGRAHPAAPADAGGGHHVVERGGQAAVGGLAQGEVVGERQDAQHRCLDHLGAAPGEQGGELLAAAGGGDPDGEAGERSGLGEGCHGGQPAALLLRGHCPAVTCR